FLGENVNEDGIIEAPNFFQSLLKLVQVMPVDRSDILKAERLEKHPRSEYAFQCLLGPFRHFESMFAEVVKSLQKALDILLDLVNKFVGDGAVHKVGECPDIFRDRHLVVIQDDDQVLVQMTRLVQTFERHAAGHGTVADDRYHLVPLL